MTTTNINIDGDIRQASDLTGTQDRTFRGAWAFNGNAVEVDMAKAVEIQKEAIRGERNAELADLDVAYMKALETSDVAGMSAIVERKNVLRDVTVDPRLAAAAQPEALKALTFDVLVAR